MTPEYGSHVNLGSCVPNDPLIEAVPIDPCVSVLQFVSRDPSSWGVMYGTTVMVTGVVTVDIE